MITKFEEFDEIDEICVGDYILIHTNSSDYSFREFINNTIGQVDNIFVRSRTKDDIEGDVIVKYNVPKQLKAWFDKKNKRNFNIKQIVVFGKTKEDIEIKKDIKKYNL